MLATKHLFIGFGDIASRCAEKLIASGESVTGIARTKKTHPEGMVLWQGDINSKQIQERIAAADFQNVVITLTPDGRNASAYRESYLKNVLSLLNIWRQHSPPGRIIFVSSTRVYGQQQGEWVDEKTNPSPIDEQGEIILACEKALLESANNAIVVRFSGIYGPGRDFLIRQVKQGNMGSEHYTNRIHVQDCVGVLLMLMQPPIHQTWPKIILASDSSPVKSSIIRRWLAEQLNIPLVETKTNDEKKTATENAQSRAGNKRCNNALLQELGYQFCYPSYQEGYLELLNS